MNLNPATVLDPVFHFLDWIIAEWGVYLFLAFVWLSLVGACVDIQRRVCASESVSLHSYRYAWADVPKKPGLSRYGSHRRRLVITARPFTAPMRGNAQVELPPLSEFERMRTKFSEMSKTLEPVMAKA